MSGVLTTRLFCSPSKASFILVPENLIATPPKSVNDLSNIEPVYIGGNECTGDKKHCYFHWELDYGLNLGLKQRRYVYWTVKGSTLNFWIILFHSFSFFLKLRFSPCPPVRYYTGQMFKILNLNRQTIIFVFILDKIIYMYLEFKKLCYLAVHC